MKCTDNRLQAFELVAARPANGKGPGVYRMELPVSGQQLWMLGKSTPVDRPTSRALADLFRAGLITDWVAERRDDPYTTPDMVAPELRVCELTASGKRQLIAWQAQNSAAVLGTSEFDVVEPDHENEDAADIDVYVRIESPTFGEIVLPGKTATEAAVFAEMLNRIVREVQ